MQQYKSIFIYGFAIFAMFFGSGNLVFPIQIGYSSGSDWLLGFLGLFITGILLPFLGLFVIKLHKGSYKAFFGEAGSFAAFLIPLFSLSLLGPFAVVPRCIIVAYGSISYIFPEISLTTFSLFFCFIVFILCIKDKMMISIIGKWLSPVLLIALSILILVGLNKSELNEISSDKAFIDGFLTGYQTMDLFAAFFFSALIFKQIQNELPTNATHKDVIHVAIKPSILGALLLAFVYFGFVFLGAHYAYLLENVAPESMLATITNYLLGKNAGIFIAIIMLLSCLTTAIALNNIYSRYICSTLKLKEDKFWLVLLISTSIAFFISMLDFKGITKLLAPALDISYPGLIALTILSIIFKGHKKFKTLVFYGISGVMIIMMLMK